MKTTAKRNHRRLPIPQHEFGFAPQAFNLFQETTLDGERIARERAEADRARSLAEAAQTALFQSEPVAENRHSRRARTSNAPSKIENAQRAKPALTP
jgi:hypothetical protein